jgi:hypothetical protein
MQTNSPVENNYKNWIKVKKRKSQSDSIQEQPRQPGLESTRCRGKRLKEKRAYICNSLNFTPFAEA